jgi:hypothetical protein
MTKAEQFLAMTAREKCAHLRHLAEHDHAGHAALRRELQAVEGGAELFATVGDHVAVLHESVVPGHKYHHRQAEIRGEFDRADGIPTGPVAPTLTRETAAFVAMSPEERHGFIAAMSPENRSAFTRAVSLEGHEHAASQALRAIELLHSSVGPGHPYWAARIELEADWKNYRKHAASAAHKLANGGK